MNQPEPQSITFSSIISDIERGMTKIPQFQRAVLDSTMETHLIRPDEFGVWEDDYTIFFSEALGADK